MTGCIVWLSRIFAAIAVAGIVGCSNNFGLPDSAYTWGRLVNAATDAYKAGRSAEGDKFLSLAIAEAERRHEYGRLIRTLAYQGEWFKKEGKTSEARQMYLRALAVSSKHPEWAFDRARALKGLETLQSTAENAVTQPDKQTAPTAKQPKRLNRVPTNR